MAHVALGSVARQIGSLFEDGSAGGLSDRQLLERFAARREQADEAAFAAIVSRHGPMVLGVCRQLLGNHHHAEDAFQAATPRPGPRAASRPVTPMPVACRLRHWHWPRRSSLPCSGTS